jgi:hypothetical protein
VAVQIYEIRPGLPQHLESLKSVPAQNAQYSVRADVFQFASKLRHCSMRSALRISANSTHGTDPELEATVAEESATDVA